MTLELTELPFITRVIVPKRRGNKVRRERLLETINARIDRKVQIICAPAGYGKTSLLVDFVNETPLPVCWYSFAREDNDPSSFLRYCLQSMRNTVEGFGDDCVALSRDSHDSDWRSQLGFFVNALQKRGSDRLIFAFDDVHWVQGKRDLEDAVALFIERSPDNVHFVIGSRVWPSLACLPKLAADDELKSMGMPDLRFAEEETAQLLGSIWDREVAAEEAAEINSRTRGWPAAIMLTARNQTMPLALDPSDSEDEGILFDYLSLEIFDGLPDFLKSFLLKSSILREFTSSQCSRLFDVADAQAIIDQIRDLGLFLEERTGNGSAYAYHDLFREFLERRFCSEEPEDYLRMHYYAAGLFADLGDHDAGIYHYLKSGAVTEVKSIVKNVADLYYAQGQWEKLSSWLDRLPKETIEKDPELLLLRGQILIRLGSPTEALTELDKLLEGSDDSSDQEIFGRALTAKSTAYRRLGHLDLATSAAEEGLSILRKTNCSQEHISEACKQLGDAFYTRGEYEQAKQSLHDALNRTSMANLRLFSLICNDLGVTYMELGDLDQAAMYLEKSKGGLLKLGSNGPLAETLNNLALVYYHKGEFDLAMDEVTEAVTKAQTANYPRVLATGLMNRAIVERALGAHTDSLNSASRALELSRQLLDQRLVAESTEALGNAYRKLGEASKAEMLLKQALLEAADSGQKYIAAVYSISLGKVHYQTGSYQQAMDYFSQAETQLAELDSLRRVAEAKLYQAAIFYRTEKLKEALNCLEQVAALSSQESFDGYLLADGQELLDVLRFGAARRVGGETFARLVQRLVVSQLADKADESGFRASGAIEKFPALKAIGLGIPRVFLDDHETIGTEWRSRKAKELFFYLLAKRQVASTEQIVEALWPDVSAEISGSSLKTTVYRVRQALFYDCILAQGSGYCINPQVSVDFDIDSFLDCLKQAKTSGKLTEEREEHLTQAVNLYKGPFLEEIYSGWCEDLRGSLEIKYHSALMDLASFHVSRGNFQEAVELLEKVIATDPYNEEAHYQYIQNHIYSNDPHSALQHLRKYARFSMEELGADLPPRFRECHQRILQLLPKTA